VVRSAGRVPLSTYHEKNPGIRNEVGRISARDGAAPQSEGDVQVPPCGSRGVIEEDMLMGMWFVVEGKDSRESGM
jgi:hypothetical protein